MKIIEQQLLELQRAASARNGLAFADALVLDQSDNRMPLIVSEVMSTPQPALKQGCEQAFPDSKYLAEVIGEYYTCIRSVASGAVPAKIYDDFCLVVNPFMTLFTQHDAAWTIPILKKLVSTLVKLALDADRATKDSTFPKSSDCTRFLSRLLAIAANDRSADTPNKKAAVFRLANLSFKVYYRIHNLRLCDTVIKNTEYARESLSNFPISEQVAYRFYIGRYYLFQHRVRKAADEFGFAFSHCSNAHIKNRRLILYYLTVSRMIIGVFPNLALLEEYNLMVPFRDLQYAIKLGNFQLVSSVLKSNLQSLLKMGVYLLLKEKLQVLCYRSLFRRVFLLTANVPAIKNGSPPTLDLAKLLVAAKFATGDQTLDEDDIECLCASLMDQGYIKGYIFRARNVVVLQKGAQFGFPPISTAVNEN